MKQDVDKYLNAVTQHVNGDIDEEALLGVLDCISHNAPSARIVAIYKHLELAEAINYDLNFILRTSQVGFQLYVERTTSTVETSTFTLIAKGISPHDIMFEFNVLGHSNFDIQIKARHIFDHKNETQVFADTRLCQHMMRHLMSISGAEYEAGSLVDREYLTYFINFVCVTFLTSPECELSDVYSQLLKATNVLTDPDHFLLWSSDIWDEETNTTRAEHIAQCQLALSSYKPKALGDMGMMHVNNLNHMCDSLFFNGMHLPDLTGLGNLLSLDKVIGADHPVLKIEPNLYYKGIFGNSTKPVEIKNSGDWLRTLHALIDAYRLTQRDRQKVYVEGISPPVK